ncbi:MAG: zinc ribbon domain-containing protein, partial [Nitrospinaceae bacterium]|nr:zinc ribbon domain-containing protein [Nitrospinaceae bacterium]
MPLYEYFCESCQMDFTLLQSTDTNKGESECSECGSRNTRYKFSS